MQGNGVLKPAQLVHLVCDDALRLLLVVRSAGHNFGPDARLGAPRDVNAGVHVHVFKVVARAAGALGVEQLQIRVNHDVGGVECRGRGQRQGGNGGADQLVGIHVLVGIQRGVHRGVAQRRDGNVGCLVVGDREVAVIHVAVGGAECGGQVAGRRRREDVLAFRDVQQIGVTGGADHGGGRGLHGSHEPGAVPLDEHAAVLC